MTRVVGLTGGVASGKSTVAAMLAQRGAAVVDADRLAREVVSPGSDGLAEVVAEFGPAVLDGRGELDRGALAAIVFADERRRRRLEAITHPRIRALLAQRIAQALAEQPPLVVADVPLLFESGLERDVDGVLLVYAPADVQVARLQARDRLDARAAGRRLRAQMPIEEKRRRATWVIDNAGTVEATAAAVDAWWHAVAGAADPLSR